MFTYRRKSWSRQRSWGRKPQRRSWLPTALILILGVPIGLELLARLAVTLTGSSSQFEVAQSEQSKKAKAYQLKFLSPTGQPYSELPHSGQLLAVRNPLMGYQLLPQQKNAFWTINSQGFRDSEPVNPEKPAGEVRIFVLGGSTAFGQLSTTGETTFAHQLEKLLNGQVAQQRSRASSYQPAVLPYLAEDVEKALALPPRIPDRQYRVINAAVPGYASGNELARLVQQIANYSPDMVIVLDDPVDLMLPSAQRAADIPGLDEVLQGQRKSMSDEAIAGVKSWFDQLYLVQGVQRYVLRSPRPETNAAMTLNLPIASGSLESALTSDAAELDRRVSRYQDHLLQMARWSSAAKKRLYVGIQPDVSQRRTPTAAEAVLVSQLGSAYAEKVKAGYGQLIAATQKVATTSTPMRLLNLSDLYTKTPEQAFQSPTSLTDAGNRVLAEQFYKAIAADLAIQPKPFGS